ncbi:unnamed protein product [[Candida] boidinii]|nr:unnamed protein product [[Candida] boidinii]
MSPTVSSPVQVSPQIPSREANSPVPTSNNKRSAETLIAPDSKRQKSWSPEPRVEIPKSISETEHVIQDTDGSRESEDDEDDEDDDFNFFGKSSEFLANRKRERGSHSGTDEYINWIKDKQFIASDDVKTNKTNKKPIQKKKSSVSSGPASNKPFAIYEQSRHKDVRPYVRNDKKFALKGYCKFFRNSQLSMIVTMTVSMIVNIIVIMIAIMIMVMTVVSATKMMMVTTVVVVLEVV